MVVRRTNKLYSLISYTLIIQIKFALGKFRIRVKGIRTRGIRVKVW